jgi:hypothetical protein
MNRTSGRLFGEAYYRALGERGPACRRAQSRAPRKPRPEKAEIDDLRRRTARGAGSGDPVRAWGSPPAAGVVPQVDATLAE